MPTCAHHFITEGMTCVQNKAITKVIILQHLSFWINPKYWPAVSVAFILFFYLIAETMIRKELQTYNIWYSYALQFHMKCVKSFDTVFSFLFFLFLFFTSEDPVILTGVPRLFVCTVHYMAKTIWTPKPYTCIMLFLSRMFLQWDQVL